MEMMREVGERDGAAMVEMGGGVGREEDEEEGSAITMWMPRMPVRVLLAEGDDSTRHVIAALLRKCGYRVSAASDGMKAWEILKDMSSHVDIVLTEVDLPLMSGFLLLSMIIEQEHCKNISVIMMSSHDSMSMVFKCMLKGAADYLVKPIRKNELRNLWQHVWRKQMANGGADRKCLTKDKLPRANIEARDLPTEGNCLDDSVSKMEDRECAEQESDVQSSCTKSDLETESKQIQKIKSGKLLTRLNAPMVDVSADEQMQPDDSSVMHEKNTRDAGGKELITLDCKEKAGEAAVDLTVSSQKDDVSQLESWLPPLELSLRTFDFSSLCKKEDNGQRVLNHSTSSPFSLYNDNRSPNSGQVSTLRGLDTYTDPESKFESGVTGSAPALTHHTPIRVLPLLFPTGSIICDDPANLHTAQASGQIDPHSAQSFWHGTSLISTEAFTCNSLSSQSAPKNLQPGDADVQSVRNLPCYSTQAQTDGAKTASSSAGESRRSSISGDTRIPPTRSNSCGGISDGFTGQAIISHDKYQRAVAIPNVDHAPALSHREMALNKFRLKRKERCFERKVRYESRRLLAEQRPRVKGQFVRHGPLKDAKNNAGG